MASSAPPHTICVRVDDIPSLLHARFCPSDLPRGVAPLAVHCHDDKQGHGLLGYQSPAQGTSTPSCPLGALTLLGPEGHYLTLGLSYPVGCSNTKCPPPPHIQTSHVGAATGTNSTLSPPPRNVGLIHWYIHLFMLCWGHVPPHDHLGAALSVPRHQHDFRHHAQTPGTKPLDQILWDVQSRLSRCRMMCTPTPRDGGWWTDRDASPTVLCGSSHPFRKRY